MHSSVVEVALGETAHMPYPSTVSLTSGGDWMRSQSTPSTRSSGVGSGARRAAIWWRVLDVWLNWELSQSFA